MPMKKKFTLNSTAIKSKEQITPKETTIAFLMNYARVYNCNGYAISETGGFILN